MEGVWKGGFLRGGFLRGKEEVETDGYEVWREVVVMVDIII